MQRPDIKVRLAQDSEAQIVGNLVAEIFHMGDWQPEWKTVFPYWLVAEIAGEIVGTINIRISLPFSSVEMLSLDPELDKVNRMRVTGMLTDSAIVIAAASGSEAVSSMIPDNMESYLKIAKRKGYIVGNHGSIVFGRTR